MEYEISFLEEYCGSSIFIKKDSSRAFSFGGNKVRIAEELLKDMRAGGYTALISYGSPTSNMNRAAADLAAREGLKCCAVVKLGDAEYAALTDAEQRHGAGTGGRYVPGGRFVPVNERLVRAAGAGIVWCTAGTVRETVERVMREYAALGEKPYYIYGDSTGHGNEKILMRASFHEYAGIAAYEAETGAAFDWIVITVGTGMTVSGLAAALHGAACGTRLLGISAARSADSLRSSISANLSLCGIGEEALPALCDSYLAGGYGYAAEDVDRLIARMAAEHGVYLDPVYTGKSYDGMLREIRAGRIGGRILYMHTGGYPNYLDWRIKQNAGR